MTHMLEGKRVIITGAAQGIGATLGKGLAALGARVMLADINDPSTAVEAVRSEGYEAAGSCVDVTRLEDCKRMVADTVAAYGGVDGLVANAALFSELPIETFDEIDEVQWDRVMAVNVKGPWLCARAVAPALEAAGGGSIVNIGTNRIFHGFPGMLHYDASKGAVLAITRSLMRELGPKNIRVNTVSPGLTMSEGVLARDGIEERAPVIAAGRALSRDQQPEDLIGGVAFFLSDLSAFIDGQNLSIDGGGIIP